MYIEISVVVALKDTIEDHSINVNFVSQRHSLRRFKGKRKAVEKWLRDIIIEPGFVRYEIVGVSITDGGKETKFGEQ
jgi:hypothetical protein